VNPESRCHATQLTAHYCQQLWPPTSGRRTVTGLATSALHLPLRPTSGRKVSGRKVSDTSLRWKSLRPESL